MRLVPDNVEQGFVTIDREGKLASERSRIIDLWFGAPEAGSTIFDLLDRRTPDFASRSPHAWIEVVDGIMPLEVTLEQMPHALVSQGAQLHVSYLPVGGTVSPERFLVVIADVTAAVARQRAERERSEMVRARPSR